MAPSGPNHRKGRHLGAIRLLQDAFRRIFPSQSLPKKYQVAKLLAAAYQIEPPTLNENWEILFAEKIRSLVRSGAQPVHICRDAQEHILAATTILPLKKSEHASHDYKLFYDTWEWKRLSFDVKIERGRKCECCGATPPAVRIITDHIKPIRHYWHLRLERSNLQVLCDDCNMGKGSRNETDFRIVNNLRERLMTIAEEYGELVEQKMANED